MAVIYHEHHEAIRGVVRARCPLPVTKTFIVLSRFITVAAIAASTLTAAGTTSSVSANDAPANYELLEAASVTQLLPRSQKQFNLLQQPPSKKTSGPSSSSRGPDAESNGDPSLPLVYVTKPTGNFARYRVRERLAGKELDNDAVGETPVVNGSIALDRDGKVIPNGSGFAAIMTKLKSDQSRRDKYIRTRLLETDSFPTTTLRITDVRGLRSPLPTSGPTNFQLIGDLTVKGVTRPTVWDVTAVVNGDELKGSAKTKFTFDQFRLTQPRVSIVLTVNDTITLEYDFVMSKK